MHMGRRLAAFTETQWYSEGKARMMLFEALEGAKSSVDDVEDQGNESAYAIKILAEYDFKLKTFLSKKTRRIKAREN